MKLSVGVGSLRNYTRLPYKLHHAIGELVDNAIQAYLDERKTLDKIYSKEKRKLTIRIHYDKQSSTLTVTDNSSGISYERLKQAMDVGGDIQRPMGDKSLGEFNVGLKSSAFWLSEMWELTTKRYDNNEEITLLIDNEKVFNSRSSEFETEESKKTVNDESHYTKLTFTNLRQNFSAQRLTITKNYIASMYRHMLNKSVFIYFDSDTDPLEWEEFELHPNPENKKHGVYRWQLGNAQLGNSGYSVSGWIGILKTSKKGEAKHPRGASASNAGISIMRRGRMIEGYPKAWKPTSIFASGAGSTVNQRIVGEINFDDADVSHTKDKISEDHKEIMDVYLGAFAKDNKIISIAKKLNDNIKKTKEEQSQATADIAEILEDANIGEYTQQPIPPEHIIEKRIDQTFESVSKDTIITYNLKAFLIRLITEHIGEDKPFLAYQLKNDTEILVSVNLDHPYHLNHFVDLTSYYLFIIMMVTARFKIEKDERLTMNDYFEVLDTMMRFKATRD